MFRRNHSSKERKSSVLTAPLPRRNKSQFTTTTAVASPGQQQQQQQQGACESAVRHGDIEPTSPQTSLQRSSTHVHNSNNNVGLEIDSKKKKKDESSSAETNSKGLPCYCCDECKHCAHTQVSSKRSRSSFVATIRKKFFSSRRSERKNPADEPSGDELHFSLSRNNRSLPRGWRSNHKSDASSRLNRSPSVSRRIGTDSHFATISHNGNKSVNNSNSKPIYRASSCVTPESPDNFCSCSLARSDDDNRKSLRHSKKQSSEQNVETAIPKSRKSANSALHFCTAKVSRPNCFSHLPTSLQAVAKTCAPESTGYGHASPPDSHLDNTFEEEMENCASGGVGGNQKSVLPYYDKVKNPSVPGWSLTGELLKLPSFGWYWGPMSRTEAERKLSNLSNGSFLVRDSSDDRHLLSLSFRSDGRTLHTRIEHFNGMFSFYARSSSGTRDEDAGAGSDAGCSSVVELIERSISDSQNGAFCYSRGRTVDSRSFPVCLSKPVSRFSQLSTLQHMCRFVLRQRVRIDHLKLLPLPPSVKLWLEETQY